MISKGVIYENLILDDCKVERVRFRVVPDEAERYDVIVARNYTDTPKLAYFRYDDKLQFVFWKIFHFQLFWKLSRRKCMRLHRQYPNLSVYRRRQ